MLSTRKNHFSLDIVLVFLILVHWIVIYRLDCVFHLLGEVKKKNYHSFVSVIYNVSWYKTSLSLLDVLMLYHVDPTTLNIMSNWILLWDWILWVIKSASLVTLWISSILSMNSPFFQSCNRNTLASWLWF